MLDGGTAYSGDQARSPHGDRLRERRRNVGSAECPRPFSRQLTNESTDRFQSSGRVAQSTARLDVRYLMVSESGEFSPESPCLEPMPHSPKTERKKFS